MISVVTPVITAGAYAALDQVGGLQVLTVDPSVSRLISVVVVDKARIKANLKLFLFSGTAAPTVVADNAPASITDAEAVSYLIAALDIPAAGYIDLAANSVATVQCQIAVQPAGGKLYAIAMAVATPTYTSTSDLTFKYGLV
jgi:hypothetical protein